MKKVCFQNKQKHKGLPLCCSSSSETQKNLKNRFFRFSPQEPLFYSIQRHKLTRFYFLLFKKRRPWCCFFSKNPKNRSRRFVYLLQEWFCLFFFFLKEETRRRTTCCSRRPGLFREDHGAVSFRRIPRTAQEDQGRRRRRPGTTLLVVSC